MRIEAKSCFVWHGIRLRTQEKEANEKELAVSSFKEDSICDELGVTSFKFLFPELGLKLEADEITAWLESDARFGNL